jgi:predicted RNase H-like nuclease (RuvC/YqgF family)
MNEGIAQARQNRAKSSVGETVASEINYTVERMEKEIAGLKQENMDLKAELLEQYRRNNQLLNSAMNLYSGANVASALQQDPNKY